MSLGYGAAEVNLCSSHFRKRVQIGGHPVGFSGLWAIRRLTRRFLNLRLLREVPTLDLNLDHSSYMLDVSSICMTYAPFSYVENPSRISEYVSWLQASY